MALTRGQQRRAALAGQLRFDRRRSFLLSKAFRRATVRDRTYGPGGSTNRNSISTDDPPCRRFPGYSFSCVHEERNRARRRMVHAVCLAVRYGGPTLSLRFQSRFVDVHSSELIERLSESLPRTFRSGTEFCSHGKGRRPFHRALCPRGRRTVARLYRRMASGC